MTCTFSRKVQYSANLDGVYVPWSIPAIAVTTEFPRYRLPDPARVLRLLISYFALDGYKRCPTPVWLQLGLGNLVACGGDREELGRLHRKVRAALARGAALGPAELFHLKPRVLGPMARDWQDLSNFAGYSQLIAQSWSVTEYLAGAEAPEAQRLQFREFLRELHPRLPSEDTFQRHFGLGFEALLVEWRAWVERAGDGLHVAPPPDQHRILVEQVVPLVANRNAPTLDRIQAVRELGRAGYVLGAECLIEQLGTESAVPTEELLWALESISGRVLGSDRAPWETWWNTLPAEVTCVTTAVGSA